MIKNSTFNYHIVTKESCLIHYNREHIAKQAIEGDCSHVLFIDSDMVFEPDAATRLLERDKDIIGAPYNCRKLPAESTMKDIDENGNRIWEEQSDGLIKCAAIATGFMLIKTEVFKKLKEPWFFFESNDKGEVVYGEDMWFCRLARQAGYEIWCDSTIQIGHIGDFIY